MNAFGTKHLPAHVGQTMVYAGLLGLWVQHAKGWGSGECSNLTPQFGLIAIVDHDIIFIRVSQ